MLTAQQMVRPQQSTALTAAQTPGIDISSIVNMIMPIFVLMMLFGMLKPMMRGMSEGFGGK